MTNLHREVARMLAEGHTHESIKRRFNLQEHTYRAILHRNKKEGVKIKLSKEAEQRLICNAMKSFEKSDKISQSRYYQPERITIIN